MNKTKLAVFCMLIVGVMVQVNVDAAGGYGKKIEPIQEADESTRPAPGSRISRSVRGTTQAQKDIQTTSEETTIPKQSAGTPCQGRGCYRKDIARTPGQRYVKKTAASQEVPETTESAEAEQIKE